MDHVVFDAELLKLAVQMESEGPCLVTGDQIGSEFLLFDDEEQELVVGHFLDRLRRGSIELSAHPIVFGVSVDAEFDGVVGYGCFGWN